MAKRYTPAQKQEALELLEFHNENVPIVHNLTGIPYSTLYRWRRQEFSINPDLMAQKNIPSIDNHSHKTDSSPQPDRVEAELIQDGDMQYYRLPTGQVVSKLPAASDSPDSPPARPSEAESRIGGVPGKNYPYPLEEDDDASADFDDFRKVRDILMSHAHHLAANLKPEDPDINRRSLALSRILDRIHQLDEFLPSLNPETVMRFEYVYNGSVYNVPPWANDDLKYLNRIRELEGQLEEALSAQKAD